ncbi:hypothetical protein Nepgr_019325 [Nepenthes gracilis]|uniref:ABC transporter domain-containing protein n=1 Tax=Nepenthes gracilis TaxID=150966 RepID=A0AAD3SV68_NEPGR|nr:hypothetical protein Nepgr_019325 [Nepenthes gracilis]
MPSKVNVSPQQTPSLSSSRPSVLEKGTKNDPDQAERSTCGKSLGNYFPFSLVGSSIAPPPLRPSFQLNKVKDKGSSNGKGGGTSLTWRDLWVTVDNKKEGRRTILEGLNGYAEPGQVLAVMGPSGCGKSTLLDALAGRLGTNMRKTGEILVNGRKQSLAYGTSAYVIQDDMLMTTLTVREAIYYSAQLQLPNSMSKSEKLERADMVIREMGLQDSINTRIGGGSKKGISGGQRRRVSICIEILTRPALLFLDEPTSGLDSAASYHVMSHIVKLAQKDRSTVVASIHQPSSEVFELFHNLCLLCSGRLVYFGPTVIAQEARGSMITFVVTLLTLMAIGGFPSFVEDMKIFQRERLNGHYGVEAYVIGNTFSSIPYLMVISLIPGAIAYYLAGLQRAFDHFVYFALLLFACMLLVESLMMIVASIVPDFLMGIITGAGVQGVMLLNGGFFRRPDDIPKLFWSGGLTLLQDVCGFLFGGAFKIFVSFIASPLSFLKVIKEPYFWFHALVSDGKKSTSDLGEYLGPFLHSFHGSP